MRSRFLAPLTASLAFLTLAASCSPSKPEQEERAARTADASPLPVRADAPTLARVQDGDERRLVADDVLAAAKLESPGAETETTSAAAAMDGGFRGVAMDAETGEPIPGLKLRLQAYPRARRTPTGERPLTRITVTTDATGAFRVNGPWAAGTCTYSSFDSCVTPTVRQMDVQVPPDPEAAEPIVFSFLGSPRYRIRTTPEVDLSGWGMVSVRKGSRKSFAAAKIQFDAEGAWCRLKRPYERIHADMLVGVVSPDGHRIGMLEVPWSREAPREALHFQLEDVGAIRVTTDLEEVADEEKSWHLPARASVRIERLTSGEPLGMDWRLQHGRFLPPGPYRVTASTREHATLEADVEVQSGETIHVPMKLELARGARTVHGVVVSDSGADLPSLGVRVVSRGDSSRSWDVQYSDIPFMCGTGLDHVLSVPRDDKSRGTFELARVPPGELEVHVHGATEAVRVTTSARADGGLDLEIRLLGDTAAGAGFRLGDRFESRDPWLTPTWEITPLDGGPKLMGSCSDGAVAVEIDPTARPFRWTVRREGCRAVHGDHEDFVDAGAGRFFADAPLIPGWSTEVRVTDRQGAPVEGAEVLSDGQLLGITDAEGSAHVDAETLPKELQVVAMDGAWQEPSKTVPGAHLMAYQVKVVLD